MGITFTDGLDIIYHSDSFQNDGAGLNGAFDEASVSFTEPQYWIGAHFPGGIQFQLYNNGQLIYTSSFFNPPGPFGFAGLSSSEPFDAVAIFDPTGGLFIDDLHFGPPIPAPSALSLLAIGALIGRRRRRLDEA